MTSGFSKRLFTGSIASIVWGSATARIITVNCIAFVIITLLNLTLEGFGMGRAAASCQLALPADVRMFATRPWTLFTYTLVNTDLLRLLFNMLWLLCFGRLLSLPMSASRLTWLYIAGGISGGVLYLAGTIFDLWHGTWLMGPSASIIAVTVATALMLPQLEINMLIIGRVKVIWVAMCVLLIYFLDIDGQNLGGNAAHVGGALTGIAVGLMRGRVPGLRLRFMEASKKKQNQKKNIKTPNRSAKEFTEEDNRRLDAILDKVKRAGYGALSDAEKRELFDISGRIK